MLPIMTKPIEKLSVVEKIGYSLGDLRWFTVNAMNSAFVPFDERLDVINERIKPGYAELRAVLAERMTDRP